MCVYTYIVYIPLHTMTGVSKNEKFSKSHTSNGKINVRRLDRRMFNDERKQQQWQPMCLKKGRRERKRRKQSSNNSNKWNNNNNNCWRKGYKPVFWQSNTIIFNIEMVFFSSAVVRLLLLLLLLLFTTDVTDW